MPNAVRYISRHWPLAAYHLNRHEAVARVVVTATFSLNTLHEVASAPAPLCSKKSMPDTRPVIVTSPSSGGLGVCQASKFEFIDSARRLT